MAAAEKIPLARTVVLVGLMGAGKSNIGRRLAQRLGVAFVDADDEIEKAAGCSIAGHLRDLWRGGVPRRRAAGDRPAAGSAAARARDRRRRVHGPATVRDKVARERRLGLAARRPRHAGAARVAQVGRPAAARRRDAREVLQALMEERYPVYAEADITIDSAREAPDVTVGRVIAALQSAVSPSLRSRTDEPGTSSASSSAARSYDIAVGTGLLGAGRCARQAARAAPAARSSSPTRRSRSCICPRSRRALAAAGIDHRAITLPPGEETKNFAHLQRSARTRSWTPRPERRSTLIALGGGVIGDLTGFAASHHCCAASTTSRCRPRCLSQVESPSAARPPSTRATARTWSAASISRAWCWPTSMRSHTLPQRELLAGYAEVVKYGLIGDADVLRLVRRQRRRAVRGGDARRARQYAVMQSCRAKARDRRRATSARRAGARCSTSATPSATPWRRRPASAPTLLHGEAVAHRHGDGVRALGAARALPAGGRRAGAPPLRRRWACRPGSTRSATSDPRPAALDRPACGSDKKVRGGAHHLHPGPRHRPRPSSRATSTWPRSRRCSTRSRLAASARGSIHVDIDRALTVAAIAVLLLVLGVLLLRRDGADRRVAPAHASAREATAIGARRWSIGCCARQEQMIGAVLLGNNAVNILASAARDRAC